MFGLMVLYAVFLSPAQAVVDCQQRPRYDEIKNCCSFPMANWQAYLDVCPENNKKLPNMCHMECIFNETQVLKNGEINLTNARQMLQKLFSNDEDFANSYALGFERCQPIIKKKAQEYNVGGSTRPLYRKKHICDGLPIFYALCAHRQVFVECPSRAWNNSEACMNAKDYAKSCQRSTLDGNKKDDVRFVKQRSTSERQASGAGVAQMQKQKQYHMK